MLVTCNKLEKGSLQYEIDYTDEFIRLDADYPESDGPGARFDRETEVSFTDINSLLNVGTPIRSDVFGSCFERHSVNNSPMLLAVLIDLNIVEKQHIGQYIVTSTL